MPEAFWAEVGPWGLVSIFVVMVLTGLLVPRWTHNQRVNDRDKQIDLLTKTIEKRDVQIETMIQQHNIVIKLLEDIKRESQTRPRGRTPT